MTGPRATTVNMIRIIAYPFIDQPLTCKYYLLFKFTLVQRTACYVYLFSFVLKPKQESIKSTTNTGEFNGKFKSVSKFLHGYVYRFGKYFIVFFSCDF